MKQSSIASFDSNPLNPTRTSVFLSRLWIKGMREKECSREKVFIHQKKHRQKIKKWLTNWGKAKFPTRTNESRTHISKDFLELSPLFSNPLLLELAVRRFSSKESIGQTFLCERLSVCVYFRLESSLWKASEVSFHHLPTGESPDALVAFSKLNYYESLCRSRD